MYCISYDLNPYNIIIYRLNEGWFYAKILITDSLFVDVNT